jgi:hypothetical protein
MSIGAEFTLLTLGALAPAEEAFRDAIKRASELFEEQSEGVRAEGAIVFSLAVSLTHKGGGSVEIEIKSTTKEPARKGAALYGTETRSGEIQLMRATQPALPGVTEIRGKRGHKEE